jgi:hypothetical protein
MQADSSRNTIIFLVCALALFIVYQMFVLEPAQKRRAAELAAQRRRRRAALRRSVPARPHPGPAGGHPRRGAGGQPARRR